MVPETGLHSLTNVTGVRTGVRPQAIRAYRGTHASPRCSVQRPLGEENLNIHRDFALYSEPLYRLRSRLLFSPSGPTALPDMLLPSPSDVSSRSKSLSLDWSCTPPCCRWYRTPLMAWVSPLISHSSSWLLSHIPSLETRSVAFPLGGAPLLCGAPLGNVRPLRVGPRHDAGVVRHAPAQTHGHLAVCGLGTEPSLREVRERRRRPPATHWNPTQTHAALRDARRRSRRRLS